MPLLILMLPSIVTVLKVLAVGIEISTIKHFNCVQKHIVNYQQLDKCYPEIIYISQFASYISNILTNKRTALLYCRSEPVMH